MQTMICYIKNNKLTLGLLILFLFLINTNAISSSSLTPNEARKALAALGISYDTGSYFNAVRRDDVNTVKLFHFAGVDIDLRSPDYNNTALWEAVDGGRYKVFHYLMDNGADINATGNVVGGPTLIDQAPLTRAISRYHFDMAWKLLRNGAYAGINKEHEGTIFATSPLSYALAYPNAQLITELLKRGASVDDLHSYNRTPLIVASGYHHPGNIEILLKAGANVRAQDTNNNTALLTHLSEGKVSFDIVRLLVNAGADVNHKNGDGYTPIFYAVLNGNEYIARFLISKGAKLNERLPENSIPWQYYNNASLHDAYGGGVTPLMIAAALGHTEIVKILLESGADVNVVVKGEHASYTAKKLAETNQHMDIVKIFNNLATK